MGNFINELPKSLHIHPILNACFGTIICTKSPFFYFAAILLLLTVRAYLTNCVN